MKKICSKCGIEKDLSEFHKQKNGKMGVRSTCKKCRYELEGEKNKQRLKIWRENPDNLEKARKTAREYKQIYSEIIKKKNKEYWDREENKQRQKEYNKTYKKMLKESGQYNEQRNKYEKQRRKRDPSFKIRQNISRRLRSLLKKGKRGTVKFLSSSIEEIKIFIESQFVEGMNWDNYGNEKGCWNIDHIVPVSKFDHSIEEEVSVCWSKENLRPLWWNENCSKKDDLIIFENLPTQLKNNHIIQQIYSK